VLRLCVQVLYGESLLSMLFPDLVFDTECWTCFDCNAKLSSAAIQAGWYATPPHTIDSFGTSCSKPAQLNPDI
jgi:hypothetical protein